MQLIYRHWLVSLCGCILCQHHHHVFTELATKKWEQRKTGADFSCCLLQQKHFCSEPHQYCNVADCMAVQIQGWYLGSIITGRIDLPFATAVSVYSGGKC